ncbi:MAG: hypothetical protein Q9213_008115 [Squamulea squamosa]
MSSHRDMFVASKRKSDSENGMPPVVRRLSSVSEAGTRTGERTCFRALAPAVQATALPAVDRAFTLRNMIKEQDQRISSATMVRKAAQDELKNTALHLNNPWDTSIRRRLKKSARVSAIAQEYSELLNSIEFED